MKKIIVLLFSFGILFTSPIKADTVLYCQSELISGVMKNNGLWKTTTFNQQRYTVKFNNDYSQLEGLTTMPWVCQVPYSFYPDQIFCVNSWGSHQTFVYSKKTKRYLMTEISSGGYVRNPEDADTDSLSVGTCKAF